MKRVAVITGVFGGIGYATAKLFHEKGWSVVGVDRKGKEDTGKCIELFLNYDVSNPEDVKKIFEDINHNYRRVDCLVNNAAIQIEKSICETTEEDWDLVYASNMKSTFMCTKYSHNMLKVAQGSIVNVSSVHAYGTSKNISAYASTKGALLAFTRAASLEFAGDSIRVNAILPGATDTEMLRAGLGRGHLSGENIEEMIYKLGQSHPMKRIGGPEEIANSIYFLADNSKSSFITGQALVVDGGALAQLSTES